MAWISSEERRRYWQSLPLSALVWMTLTAFLTFASVELAANLVDGLRWPFWWVLAKATLFGAIMALTFVTILRNPKSSFPGPHSHGCSRCRSAKGPVGLRSQQDVGGAGF
jgi:hypothetical protein